MQSDSGDRRIVKSQFLAGAPQTEQEKLPCPRCESTYTKFCYYNNYNLNQPRHFCKSCRRYWTQGGALRNIPVGGGTRKKARCGCTTPTPTTPTTSSSSPSPQQEEPEPVLSISSQPSSSSVTSVPLIPTRSVANLNSLNIPVGGISTFLNTTPGFFTLNGFGYGLGSGFNELGSIWNLTLPGMMDVGAAGGNVNPFCNGGDVVYSGDNDCVGWPDLTTSAPRKSVK